MAKTPINWSDAMKLCELGPYGDPSKVFSGPIVEATGHLVKQINKADKNRSKAPIKITEIPAWPEEGSDKAARLQDIYVAQAALLLVFERFGVLEDYYQAACYLEVGEEVDTGWKASLRRPGSCGLFHVEFVEETPEFTTDIERVRYLAVAA